MRNLKIILWLILILSFGDVFGDNVTQINIPTSETNCNGGIWTSTYYLGETRYFADLLSGDSYNDIVIGYAGSNIRVYNPYGAINFLGPYTFKSNLKPAGIESIIVASCDAGANISGHAPARSTLAAQLVYSIARKYNIGFKIGVSGTYAYTLPNWTYVEKTYTNKPDFDSSPIIQDNECVNIYIAWCGDGILDSGNGERCDPADTTHAGWGTGGCNASCQPITRPVCIAGTVTGTQTAPITVATPGLCPAGQTVGNFTDSLIGTTHNYTWSCNGNIGGNCSASYTPTAPTVCCNSLTANPTSGTTPLTSTLTCVGTNATSYLVNCGNGSSFNTSVGTCSYTSAGTYSASCTVNGNITSTACNTTITATSPVCIAGTVTGTQTAPITVDTPGLCPAGQTVGNFTDSLIGTTHNYTWSCNGNIGGNCSASYTPAGPVVSCDSLTANPASGTMPLTSTLTCVGTNATSYLVNCGNGSSFATSVGTCSYPSAGTYSASCTVNGSITSTACNTSITANPSSSSSSSSGGGHWYACNSPSTCFDYSTNASCSASVPAGVTCYENDEPACLVTAPTQCPPSSSSSSSSSGGGHWYACNSPSTCFDYPTDASCSATVPAGRTCYNNDEPACLATAPTQCPPSSSSSSSGGSSSSSSSSGGGPYCGNGIKEVGEQCDQYDGTPIGRECDIYCMIRDITQPRPGLGDIYILNNGPGGLPSPILITSYKGIIGNDVSVFSPLDSIIFRLNDPNMYLAFNNVQVCINDNSNIIKSSLGCDNDKAEFSSPSCFCKRITGEIGYGAPSNELTLFEGSELADKFKGYVSFSDTYKDTTSNSFYINIQWLTGDIGVRVSRPAIANTAGGNAYLGVPAGYDVNSIVENFLNDLKNGNFVTTSLNKDNFSTDQNISSFTKQIIKNDFLNSIVNSGSSIEYEKINSLSQKQSTLMVSNINTFTDFDSLDSLGDNNDIKISKNGSIQINSSSWDLQLSGKKTVIVENGDLVINRNIIYNITDSSSSWAFIVKNGNIKIANNVTKIAGIFMTLNGSIVSDGIQTPNQLSIDGSLYGDTSNLINNRTYIKGGLSSEALSTGIIINYSNRAIKNPPPLLTNFLEQFNLQRISK